MKNILVQLLSVVRGVELNVNRNGLNFRGHGIEVWIRPAAHEGEALRVTLEAPALGVESVEMNLGKPARKQQGLSGGTYQFGTMIRAEDGSPLPTTPYFEGGPS